MSQCAPTTPDVAAATTVHTYQGTAAATRDRVPTTGTVSGKEEVTEDMLIRASKQHAALEQINRFRV